MTLWVFLLTAVAGGVGASFRYAVELLIRARVKRDFPWATVVINVSGSFLLGLLTGLAGQSHLPGQLATILGVGLLGGYTTFSTASFETIRLLNERRYTTSLLYALGTLIICCVAAAAGWWLGAF